MRFVIGVMGELNPAVGLTEEGVRSSLEVMFQQTKRILPRIYGSAEVLVVSGPTSGDVARIAYTLADSLSWQHEVQEDWLSPESTFHRLCDMLIKVSDPVNAWFDLQEKKYRERRGDEASFWLLGGVN